MKKSTRSLIAVSKFTDCVGRLELVVCFFFFFFRFVRSLYRNLRTRSASYAPEMAVPALDRARTRPRVYVLNTPFRCPISSRDFFQAIRQLDRELERPIIAASILDLRVLRNKNCGSRGGYCAEFTRNR